MKVPLICVFILIFTVSVAWSQACERTFTVGGLPPGLLPDDLEAKLGRQDLSVTKIEPITSSRVFILLSAGTVFSPDKIFQERIRRLDSIAAIPANTSMAYGVVSKNKIVASPGFTSNAQELRNSLHDLITRMKAGTADSALKNPLDFFQEPRPGDAVVLFYASLWLEPTVETFLQKKIRLFTVGYQDLNEWDSDDGVVPYTTLAEATGGHASMIGGDTTLKRYEEPQWLAIRDEWLYGMTSAYMVTVAIPDGIRAKDYTWQVKLRDSAKNRLGIPGKMKFVVQYPDLLLCSPESNGRARVAAVVPRLQL